MSQRAGRFVSEGYLNELLEDAGERMKKSVDSTRTEFETVRTGRATPHLLDRVEVDYYGATTPLRQLASTCTESHEAKRTGLELFVDGPVKHTLP